MFFAFLSLQKAIVFSPSPALQVLCCTSPMNSPCFEPETQLGFSAKRCCSEAVLRTGEI